MARQARMCASARPAHVWHAFLGHCVEPASAQACPVARLQRTAAAAGRALAGEAEAVRRAAAERLRALEEAGVSAEKIAVVRRLAQRVVVGM